MANTSDIALPFNRQHFGPLETNSVFPSKAEADVYAAGLTDNSTTAYAGQTVIWLDGAEYQSGIIQPTGAISPANSSGGASGKLETLLLGRLKDKHLSILGDSVSSYVGTFSEYPASGYYPIGDVDSVNKMWWKIICDQLGMKWLVNNSVSGSSLTSGTSSWSVMDAQRHLKLHTVEKDPDIIFVEIGGNDIMYMTGIGAYNNSAASVDTGADFTRFRDAYGKMIHAMRSRYTKASVHCCTLAYYPQMTDANPNVKMTIAEANDIIRSIASGYGCNILELGKCILQAANASEYTPYNGVHPNAAGMQLVASELIPRLLANESGGAGLGAYNEPAPVDVYSARVRSADGSIAWKNIFQRGSDEIPAKLGNTDGATFSGATTKPTYAPYYLKNNDPLRGKYITKIRYGYGVGVLTVGYRNVNDVAIGDTTTAEMDGWLFKITPGGQYGSDTFALDGTDSRVELNPAELVHGGVFIPASGRILAWQVNGAGATGAMLVSPDINTQMEFVITDNGKIAANPTVQYLGCELTLVNSLGGTDYVNPELKALENRIKTLEAKIN